MIVSYMVATAGFANGLLLGAALALGVTSCAYRLCGARR
jgi:hypothetical protein